MYPSRTLSARGASICVALALAACADDSVRPPVDEVPPSAPVADTPPSLTRLELRDDMRRLWQDHVIWTRVFIIDAVAGLPDLDLALGRLLQNQVDLGRAFATFYGGAGDRLTALLRTHIIQAGDIVAAARDGDRRALETARRAWRENADDIADLLSSVNERWPFEVVRHMMHEHLDQTEAEAIARLEGRWDDDVAAYDAIVFHILDMADVLTDGIADQFPARVAGSPLGAQDERVHLEMRKLWTDHVVWTRMFIISAVAGLPDLATTTERLLQNQADLGQAISPFYGDAAADRLTDLLREHILIAAQIVFAAKASDSATVESASRAWSVNAAAIAEFLASANPAWSRAELEEMMGVHLSQTTVEATARLQANWARDIAIFDEIVLHILHMADTLSAGLVVGTTTEAPVVHNGHH
jgi:hypothetical protein